MSSKRDDDLVRRILRNARNNHVAETSLVPKQTNTIQSTGLITSLPSVEILETLKKDFVGDRDQYVLRCAFCGGSGHSMMWIRNQQGQEGFISTGDMCPVCNGRGLVKVWSYEVILVHTYCQGTGRNQKNKSQQCPGCSGYGMVGLTGRLYEFG